MFEPSMNFDTHKSIKFLISKGIKEPQAESIVEVVSKSREYDFSKLVTKDQLELAKAEIKGEIAEIRGELAALKEEIMGEMATLEERLIGKIIASNHNTLKWMIPFLIGILLTVFFKH